MEHPTDQVVTTQQGALVSGSAPGLTNLGNTCFFNASVQMLLSCKPLTAALQTSRAAASSPKPAAAGKVSNQPSTGGNPSDNHDREASSSGTAASVFSSQAVAVAVSTHISSSTQVHELEPPGSPLPNPAHVNLLGKGPLGFALQQVIMHTSGASAAHGSHGKGSYNPQALLSAVTRLAPQFKGKQQHDAHELFRILVDGLETEEQRAAEMMNKARLCSPKSGPPPGCPFSPTGAALSAEPVAIMTEQIFGGKLASTVTCTSCGHQSVTKENFMDLSLPIPLHIPSKAPVAAAVDDHPTKKAKQLAKAEQTARAQQEAGQKQAAAQAAAAAAAAKIGKGGKGKASGKAGNDAVATGKAAVPEPPPKKLTAKQRKAAEKADKRAKQQAAREQKKAAAQQRRQAEEEGVESSDDSDTEKPAPPVDVAIKDDATNGDVSEIQASPCGDQSHIPCEDKSYEQHTSHLHSGKATDPSLCHAGDQQNGDADSKQRASECDAVGNNTSMNGTSAVVDVSDGNSGHSLPVAAGHQNIDGNECQPAETPACMDSNPTANNVPDSWEDLDDDVAANTPKHNSNAVDGIQHQCISADAANCSNIPATSTACSSTANNIHTNHQHTQQSNGLCSTDATAANGLHATDNLAASRLLLTEDAPGDGVRTEHASLKLKSVGDGSCLADSNHTIAHVPNAAQAGSPSHNGSGRSSVDGVPVHKGSAESLPNGRHADHSSTAGSHDSTRAPSATSTLSSVDSQGHHSIGSPMVVSGFETSGQSSPFAASHTAGSDTDSLHGGTAPHHHKVPVAQSALTLQLHRFSSASSTSSPRELSMQQSGHAAQRGHSTLQNGHTAHHAQHRLSSEEADPDNAAGCAQATDAQNGLSSSGTSHSSAKGTAGTHASQSASMVNGSTHPASLDSHPSCNTAVGTAQSDGGKLETAPQAQIGGGTDLLPLTNGTEGSANQLSSAASGVVSTSVSVEAAHRTDAGAVAGASSTVAQGEASSVQTALGHTAALEGQPKPGLLDVHACLAAFFEEEKLTWECAREKAEWRALYGVSPGSSLKDGSSPMLRKQVSFSSQQHVILVPGSAEQRGTDLQEAARGAAPFRRAARCAGAACLVHAQLDSQDTDSMDMRLLPQSGDQKAAKLLPKGPIHLARVDVGRVWRGTTPREQLHAVQDVAVVLMDCVADLLKKHGLHGLQAHLAGGIQIQHHGDDWRVIGKCPAPEASITQTSTPTTPTKQQATQTPCESNGLVTSDATNACASEADEQPANGSCKSATDSKHLQGTAATASHSATAPTTWVYPPEPHDLHASTSNKAASHALDTQRNARPAPMADVGESDSARSSVSGYSDDVAPSRPVQPLVHADSEENVVFAMDLDRLSPGASPLPATRLLNGVQPPGSGTALATAAPGVTCLNPGHLLSTNSNKHSSSVDNSSSSNPSTQTHNINSSSNCSTVSTADCKSDTSNSNNNSSSNSGSSNNNSTSSNNMSDSNIQDDNSNRNSGSACGIKAAATGSSSEGAEAHGKSSSSSSNTTNHPDASGTSHMHVSASAPALLAIDLQAQIQDTTRILATGAYTSLSVKQAEACSHDATAPSPVAAATTAIASDSTEKNYREQQRTAPPASVSATTTPEQDSPMLSISTITPVLTTHPTPSNNLSISIADHNACQSESSHSIKAPDGATKSETVATAPITIQAASKDTPQPEATTPPAGALRIPRASSLSTSSSKPPKPSFQRPATKCYSLLQPPRVLVLHLKRFQQDMRGRLSKIDRHVAFDTVLDLGLYVARTGTGQLPGRASPNGRQPSTAIASQGSDLAAAASNRRPDHASDNLASKGSEALGVNASPVPQADGHSTASSDSTELSCGAVTAAGAHSACAHDAKAIGNQAGLQGPKFLYDLVGVVEHQGQMRFGHYVAYIKRASGTTPTGYQWYYASDASVKAVSEAEVLRAQAYLLMYVQRAA